MPLRDRLSRAFQILAQRLSREPKYVEQSRLPTSSGTVAGVHITPDNVLSIPTAWACHRYLTQTVAVLPWHAMKGVDGGAEIQSRHPVDYLLHKRPNPEMSSFQFRETLLGMAVRWGNGYAEIERDDLGRPLALWPLQSERTTVCRDENTGELFYEVNNGASGKVQIEARNMFHIRGFSEGPVGISVVDVARQSLGWARAAQLYGASFFGNGATPSVVVKNKTALTVDGLKAQKAEFSQLYRGATKAHKTAHIDNDASIEVLTFNAQETQLIETHMFLVEEVCRWFGVPPHKVSHLLRATFSNIEHQAIEAVTDSISPWVKRFEDEADHKLFGNNRSGIYTKMNMTALLRGDSASRAAFYKEMVQVGAMSPNEVRGLEDLNSIGPDGDIHVMQSQNVTLETIKEGPPELAAPAPAPAPAPKPEPAAIAVIAPPRKKVITRIVTRHDDKGRILEMKDVHEEVDDE